MHASGLLASLPVCGCIVGFSWAQLLADCHLAVSNVPFHLPTAVQDFPKIATFLPGRTVQEVIRLYYAIQVGCCTVVQLVWEALWQR